MSRSAFNATTLVKGDTIYMLARGEDQTGQGRWNGTSRIFLGESKDGLHFRFRRKPVLGPTEGFEEHGGTEDPRLVEVEGKYYLTYTAYQYSTGTARLALAVSDDLVHWEKKGPIFPEWKRPNGQVWSKSGGIVPRKINGEYLMYFGDENIYLARSKDLLHWTPDPEPVLRPREGFWDGILAEPGPPPWVDDVGNIHLLYNGDAPPQGYSSAEVVFSGKDPRKILRRANTPLLKVTEPFERDGQVGNVIFLEGLAKKDGQAFFYYGAADDQIAVAVADLKKTPQPPER
jgi:beta-1,2-mannosidase